ncbi:glycosyltransferase family A protein [Alcanivorax sp. 1008]|uniref:glycosyltransferase family 2 protein n=1 Tax=Alcanivorax sp. 1008 TaxID=2816853 RepID=UPI001DA834EF|nr:glycosyltransferase family A protein [Alcanivorax sp. 1008]MCC1495295.1 glycosyltransferase family 2 protein [Alcanivorax sp. 1008]
MPIFNEARFIAEALDAITAQSYPNVEILISDNCSTDDTQRICEEYCRKFPHITYHRFAHNQGAAANFRYTLENSHGKYFMWAAGHDRWSTDYLEKSVAALELHPHASLSFASTTWIDGAGNSHAKSTGWSDTRGLDPVARFFTVFWGNMNPVLGLIRREYLQPENLKDIVGTDLILLVGLALRGDFIHAEGPSWNRREFRSETSYKQKLQRYNNNDYKLTHSFFDKLMPLARLPLSLIGAVTHSQQPRSVKTLILLALIPCLAVKYFCGKYLTPRT